MRILGLVAFCAAAFVATLLAQGIWTGVLLANLATTPDIPWAIIPMAVLLWLIWRYLGGAWSPQGTSAARRHYRRAEPVDARIWRVAIAAGFLGLGALVALWLVLGQVVDLRPNGSASYDGYALLTVVAVIAMASIVGAVTEELGLRGYMLTRLEETIGGWPAVLVVAIVIAPGHAATQGFAFATAAWYFLSDLLLGALALLSRSIRPGIVIHATGLLIFFAVIWPTDHLRHAGPLSSQDPSFWIEVGAVAVFGVLALVALSRLRSLSRSQT